MILYWTAYCTWVFGTWTSNSVGALILGMFLVALFVFASVGLSFYKSKILKDSRMGRTLSYCLGLLLKIFVMFIVMTMNGWVVITVILAMTAGQIFFTRVPLFKVKKHLLET